MITGNMKIFINKLRKQEGGKIHRNKTEFDITSSCGVYRFQHPDAKVFQYIDDLAKSIGITKESTQWSQQEIDKINNIIDKDLEDEFTAEFYQTYFKYIDFNKLHKCLLWSYASIYVTSNRLANKALQKSTNYLLQFYPDIFNKDGSKELLKVDGIIGNGSRALIYDVSSLVYENNPYLGHMWKSLFINACKDYYVEIATSEVEQTGTDKDLRYLRGWINRCNDLLGDVDDLR